MLLLGRCLILFSALVFPGMALVSPGVPAGAQTPASNAVPAANAAPNEDPLAQLTPEQKERFQSAEKVFLAEHYAEALVNFRILLDQVPAGGPAQVLLAKYAAEAALNTGDRGYAAGLLKPIEAAHPGDWQAKALLARFYAETGERNQRDAELAALVLIHKRNPDTPVGKLNQILLERDVLPDNGGSLRIWYSLEPWGKFKTYVFTRVYDAAGAQRLRITLESSDFDQPLFSKEHPELAAKGERRFSLDGYGQDQKNSNGTVTQTHMTFGFFDGQPGYDVVRERILAIAEGKKAPMSRMDPGVK